MTQAPGQPEGHLRPTSGASLATMGSLGLVGGWLVRPVMVRATGTAPYVTWVQGLALIFVAVVLAYVAFTTWQTIHVHRRRMDVDRAVNRFVLARACALVGALAAGGYAGYAVTWLGDPSEIAEQRLARCAVAALGGLLVMLASLLLERACRVPPDAPGP